MPVIITGSSDDLIEVDGDIRKEFTYRYETPKGHGPASDILAFSDGTVLRIAFDPDGSGNWRITPLAQGTATLTVVQSTEEEGTDTATLDGDIRWVVHGTGWAKA